MQNLLEGLNDKQLEAVTHIEGPLMLVAGAGTGKTTVITQRIAWLIEQRHAESENILALTFTDKAAGEMEERVDMLLPIGYVDLRISTFHSFAERLLRDHGVEIGLSRDFSMIDTIDAWLLTGQNIDRFELDYYRPLGNPTKYIRALLQHFSRLKDAGIDPENYLAFVKEKRENLAKDAGEDELTEIARLEELANAYQTYQQVLADNDSLDFGDLMLYTIKLLEKRPNILKKLQEQFTFILVDEFQDTNEAQYKIINLLAAAKRNLTVVGDDDQAIYKFRGASLSNILQFETDYPDAKKIVLTDNYRSSQEILDASYEFIQKNNPNRLETRSEDIVKKLQSHKPEPGIIEHLHGDRLEDEAEHVKEKILEIKKKDPEADWNDFAILTRSNDAALPFIASLEKQGIPFQFLALRGLYAKPAVLDLLSFIRVVNNPYESPSLYRAFISPVIGLTPQAVAVLTNYARRKGKTLYEAAEASAVLGLDEDTFGKIDDFLAKRRKWSFDAQKKGASEMLLTIAKEIGYVEYLNTLDEREKLESFGYLQQIYERVKKFELRHEHSVLRNFLEEFDQEREAGEEGSLAPDMEFGPDMVRIMTIHASKGLEFKYVFVINLVDRRFPTSMRRDPIPLPDGLASETSKDDSQHHLEEERRLMYVAMTRAKLGLFLCSSEDYGGARKKKLSRFLHEMGYEIQGEGKRFGGDIFTDEEERVEVENGQLIYHLPKQFSFTQLMSFKMCPLQYKFAHVLKIPVLGKWTFSFGKTMHNTLERFFKLWMERIGSPQASLFDEPKEELPEIPVSEKELMELYENAWIDDWYMDDAQREKYRAKGKESIKGFYKHLSNSNPNPAYIEQGFTLKIGDIVVKGRIDRIDACEDGVEIIDYKTGKPKTKLEATDKEQLLLYQLAARDVLGLNVKKLTFHYLEDNSIVSFLGKDDELLKLSESIVERVTAIRDSNFLPTPGRHCTFCDFADICEFRQK